MIDYLMSTLILVADLGSFIELGASGMNLSCAVSEKLRGFASALIVEKTLSGRTISYQY
jgi:hypothetical protein